MIWYVTIKIILTYKWTSLGSHTNDMICDHQDYTDLQMHIIMVPHKWYDLWPSRKWPWLTNARHYGPTQMIWFVTIKIIDWLTNAHHYGSTQTIWFVTITKMALTYKCTSLWSHTNDMNCDHQENGPDLQMDRSMVPHKWYDLWPSR